MATESPQGMGPDTPDIHPKFVFAGCKFGFEQACKSEVLDQCPNLKFSFSRPGFQTYKVQQGAPDFSKINSLKFVRIAGLNRGQVVLDEKGQVEESVQSAIRDLVKEFQIRTIHAWNRNLGDQNDDLLLGRHPDHQQGFIHPEQPSLDEFTKSLSLEINQPARKGHHVLDLITVDRGKIWDATHQAETPQQCWPGGVIGFRLPEKLVSRAYLKTRESMIWSRFPFRRGETCIEIGCAPGGSAQALLGEGLRVVGIDPALVEDSIRDHPNFFQIRKRGADVRKKDLADANWLFADSNVAPKHSLDTIEEIVTNQHLNVRGMIITLKLLQPKLIHELEQYLERIRGMGFGFVRARQLAFNRNEICVAALRKKSILRFGRLSKGKTKPPGEKRDPKPGES